MPFNRPTLPQLIARAQNDFKRIPNSDPQLRFTVEDILAKGTAGLTHGAHGHVAFVGRQILPTTADDEGVLEWADTYSIPRVLPGKAQLVYRFTGTEGSTIPALEELTRSDGALFTTNALGTIVGGQADVVITADEAGAEGNAVDGSAMALSSPVAGIDSAGTVQSTSVTGVDIEDIESVRDRVVNRLAQAPTGGNDIDFEELARSVAGVTRVFVRGGLNGLGTVAVFFARDNDPDGPIPDSGEVAAVQSAFDNGTSSKGAAPTIGSYTATAPIAVPLNPDVTITPNTAAVQAAVTAQLDAFLLDTDKNAPDLIISLNDLNEVISVSPGLEQHVLNSPSAPIVLANNELATLGTPVYS